MAASSSDLPVDLELVALALAKVIARKHVDADPKLARLDPIGRVSAISTMARSMVGELFEEAEAAAEAVCLQLLEPYDEPGEAA